VDNSCLTGTKHSRFTRQAKDSPLMNFFRGFLAIDLLFESLNLGALGSSIKMKFFSRSGISVASSWHDAEKPDVYPRTVQRIPVLHRYH
jgi:hypothetical protein